MYILRRVHAEQGVSSDFINLWVYQWESADLNSMLAHARFNLKPIAETPRVRYVDVAPDQHTLPGCLWQGRTDEVFDYEYGCSSHKIHSITHCQIFNITKCWYSPVLSREVMESDIDFGGSTDFIQLPFSTLIEYVNFFTTNPGIGICHPLDIKPWMTAKP